MKTKKQLNSEAVAILQRLANGETINDIETPGFTPPASIKLLGSSVKIEKGHSIGIHSSILYLAPSDSAAIMRKGKRLNVCPWATKYCRSACLGLKAGQMVWKSSFNSRLWKTALYFAAPTLFMQILENEIVSVIAKAKKKSMVAAIRLNGTSDLNWLKYDLPSKYPDAQFYEYSKSPGRVAKFDGKLKNYHLTYSANSNPGSSTVARQALDKGLSVAAIVPKDLLLDENSYDLRSDEPIFHTQQSELVNKVCGGDRSLTYVRNGDDSDARFLDKGSKDGNGTIIFLKIKGGRKNLETMGRDVFYV